MAERKILGLNTEFDSLEYDNFEENRFSSSISLLDYDAIIIDTNYLVGTCYGTGSSTYQNKLRLSDYASSQINDDFSKIKEQIIELLRLGRNLFILMGNNESCYIFTGEKQFSGTGKNARQTNIIREFDTYSFLPIDIQATHVFGEKIIPCCNQPYNDFFKRTSEYSHYASYFSINNASIPLAKIKGTEKTVAAVIPYENGKIICLPQPYYEEDYTDYDDWVDCGNAYLEAIFELDARLSTLDKNIDFPSWANDIFILNEKEEISKRNQIENEINELQHNLSKQNQHIDEIQKYKLLLTASGDILEEISKQVLSELGFSILDTEKGRSDIIAKYGEIGIVAEIKGVSKSAAERHAAQLEKWVSQYIEENDSIPKGILIVNGFCDIPILHRTEDVFPPQMLKYCESRNHALITTTQLLCLFIDIKQNPTLKEDRINELLSCVGIYQRYKNASDYLDIYANAK